MIPRKAHKDSMGVSIRDTGLPMPPTPTESTGKHMYTCILFQKVFT